jgi:hypothetical protein
MTRTLQKTIRDVVMTMGPLPLMDGPNDRRKEFNAAVNEATRGDRKSIAKYVRSGEPIARYERKILAILLEDEDPKKHFERLIIGWARKSHNEVRAREGLSKLPPRARTSILLLLKRLFDHVPVDWAKIKGELDRGEKRTVPRNLNPANSKKPGLPQSRKF